MEWQPWYKFVIIALIIGIVKVLQQNTKKEFKLNADKSDKNTINSSDLDVKSENINHSTFEGSVYNLALNLIYEMGFILVDKNLSNTHDYEITLVNYEKSYLILKDSLPSLNYLEKINQRIFHTLLGLTVMNMVRIHTMMKLRKIF